MTDRPLGPSVVVKVVEGDGDATVLAVLPDTDSPSGPSEVDEVVEGDGDATVLVVLPDIYGTDGPLGSSDTNMAKGGDGGTKPAHWGHQTPTWRREGVEAPNLRGRSGAAQPVVRPCLRSRS